MAVHHTSESIKALQLEVALECRLGKVHEQAFAYFAITNHMIDTVIVPSASAGTVVPLRCKLIGEGGSGKSHVIRAITTFLRRAGRGNIFVRAAPTGVAAIGIDGSTVHSLLGWRVFGRADKGGTRELTANAAGRTRGTATASSTEARERVLLMSYLLIDEL
jgi:hypothetical protein